MTTSTSCQSGTCASCEKESKLLVCTRCRIVGYCNKTCQRSDWKVHKRMCKPFEELKRNCFVGAELLDELNEKKNLTGLAVMYNFNQIYSNPEVLEFMIEQRHQLSRSLNSVKERKKLMNWYKNALIGDFYDRKLENEILSANTAFDGIRYEFSNAAPAPLLSLKHLAVGFVDLGILAYADANGILGRPLATALEDEKQKLTFVAVDATATHVAKSLVIWEMAKTLSIEDCRLISQVWYSSVWEQETYDAFISACKRILRTESFSSYAQGIPVPCTMHNASVRDHIREWSQMERNDSIEEFLSSLPTHNLRNFVQNFTRLEDRVHVKKMFNYGSACLDVDDVSCSLTWSRTVPFAPPASDCDQTQFGALPTNRLLRAWIESGNNICDVAFEIMNHGAKQLIELAQSNRVHLELIHGTVLESNIPLVDDLASRKFESISWSNIVDYFNKKQFHSLANKIAAENCIHFAYSMNWVEEIYGSHALDERKDETIGDRFERGIDWLKKHHQQKGVYHLLKRPPFAMTMQESVGMAISDEFAGKWVDKFMEFGQLNSVNPAEGSVLQPRDGSWTEPSRPAGVAFSQAQERVCFAWSYDQNCLSRKIPCLNL